MISINHVIKAAGVGPAVLITSLGKTISGGIQQVADIGGVAGSRHIGDEAALNHRVNPCRRRPRDASGSRQREDISSSRHAGTINPREDSIARVWQQNRAGGNSSLAQHEPLVGAKEENFVSDDAAAELASELIAVQEGQSDAVEIIEEAVARKFRVTVVFVDGAVKVVRPARRDELD